MIDMNAACVQELSEQAWGIYNCQKNEECALCSCVMCLAVNCRRCTVISSICDKAIHCSHSELWNKTDEFHSQIVVWSSLHEANKKFFGLIRTHIRMFKPLNFFKIKFGFLSPKLQFSVEFYFALF